MTPIEMLIDLMEFNANWIKNEVADMPTELLYWTPDPAANSINVTIWHVARMLDVFLVRFLQGQTQEDELWFRDGWDKQVNYDSRGLGIAGFGSVIGYTAEEVAAIPQFERALLFDYFDQTHQAIYDYLRGLPEGGLDELRQWGKNEQPVYAWVRHVFQDSVRHCGEILTLQAMRERQQQA
ncbi:MAG: DinB family protein [Anaerolineales bacterium]|nr:DinB family protein [Anaerolineales bacterium]MCB9431226.1 DinB family protein [Ardenticatenaceae bacterium]